MSRRTVGGEIPSDRLLPAPLTRVRLQGRARGRRSIVVDAARLSPRLRDVLAAAQEVARRGGRSAVEP